MSKKFITDKFTFGRLIRLFFILGFIFFAQFLFTSDIKAATGINQQLNFQGRLLDSTGAVVPDGSYNMEFKIVQDGDGCNPTSGSFPCSGTVLWTETRKQTDRVTVRNGYFSVNLGSVTAFAGSVDWNQDTLWVSINVGGTANTATPTFDGEMKPLKRLTASPYAFNSSRLGGLTSSAFGQLTASNTWTQLNTFSASGTALSVTNNATIGGTLSLGTSSASNSLDVRATNSVTSGEHIVTVVGNVAGTAGILSGWYANGSSVTGGYMRSINSLPMFFGTSGTSQALTILNTGEIGIGDTSPAALLTVGTSDAFQVNASGNVTTSGTLAVNGGTISASTTLTLDSASTVIIPDADSFRTNDVTSTGALSLVSGGTSDVTIDGASGIITLASGDVLKITGQAGDPGTCTAGAITYDSTDQKLRGCEGSVWSDLISAGGGGGVTTVGAIDTTPTAANGARISGSSIFMQYADGSFPGLISTTSQTIAGVKTLTSTLTLGGALGITTTSNQTLVVEPNGGGDVELTVDDDSNFQVLGTVTNTGYAQQVTISLGNDADVDTVSGFSVDATSANTGDADNFYGININNLSSPSTTVNEYALNIGVNWDRAIMANGLVTVGTSSNSANIEMFGDLIKKSIKKQIPLTGIIDVFVYDTTRDSDGGAWTNSATSRGLSWATESKDDGPGDACDISTDDRCGNSEFPKKAAIVSTVSDLYIFNVTDGKMFMKFTQTGGTYSLGADTNNNPSGVFALNGAVYVGTNGASGSGLYAFDFTKDVMYNYDVTDRSQGDKDIAHRNSAVTYNVNNMTKYALNNSVVNDVHGAIVSANAVTSSATVLQGSGSTLIAAATDGRVSVINLTAARVLDYGATTTDDFNQVWVTRRARMYATNETLSELDRWDQLDVDTADQGAGDDIFDEQAANMPHLAKTVTTMSTSPDALQVVENGSLAHETNVTTVSTGDLVYVGHSQGLTEIHDNMAVGGTQPGWSKFYNTTGSTALMHGVPRAMFGFDNVSGDITDATIRNNTLTPKGSPTYQTNGVHGFAPRMNGTSQYFCSGASGTCATDADYGAGTTSFSISLWFKHSTTISGTDTILDNTYSTANVLGAGFRIYMNASGQIVAGIDDDGTAFDDDLITSTAGTSFADGQWHHLLFQRVTTALTAPAHAAGLNLYIDGKNFGTDTAIAATATLTSSSILAIGADCSVGAACSTGANFWDGEIDDVYINMGGTTTQGAINGTTGAPRRIFQEGKAAQQRPSTAVTDGSIFSSTTIGTSSNTYIPNEFVGTMVEITGGTGVGQTRRVVSNTATTLTVSPAWTTTPDATSDYMINPEKLYGASNSVTSVAVTDSEQIGRMRTVLVGTNNGTDGGGVTQLAGYANTAIADVYHSDSGFTDDTGTGWTGTDADDMQAVEYRSGAMVIASQKGLVLLTDEKRFDQWFDNITNAIANIRSEMTQDGLNGTASETGNLGVGADLAERFISDEDLMPGDIVSMEPNRVGAVKKATKPYDSQLVGIVATEPGLIIGPVEENSYNIALVGRVPVKVTNENGEIKAGDRITSSSISGYGVKAINAGRVVGTALDDFTPDKELECPSGSPPDIVCGTVTAFVNLVDYGGQGIEQAISEAESDGYMYGDSIFGTESWLLDAGQNQNASTVQEAERILRYLAGRNTDEEHSSEILTEKIASNTIIGQDVYAQTLTVDTLKANKIEGLELVIGQITGRPVEPSEGEEGSITGDEQVDEAVVKLGSAEGVHIVALAHLEARGTLTVDGGATFNGKTSFMGLVEFFGLATFNDKVAFNDQVTFNSDTAGKAVIKQGSNKVTVTFKKPYASAPLVNSNVLLEDTKDANGVITEAADIKQQRYLAQGYFAMVANVTNEGFTIILNKNAEEDLTYSWLAISVSDVTLSLSN